MHTIHVEFPDGTYHVMIEPGLLKHLGEIVALATPHERALLVVDRNVAADHGAAAAASLEEKGFSLARAELVADEKRKTLDVVAGLYETMLAEKLERRSPVIAVGGGLIGDVAGFAAATYLRGVPIIQVPTTLLAMVDASVGGKTGVNHVLPTGDLGKNLVGAFWQPRAVVVDPEVLATLSDRDYRCGLAECVKHGLIADVDLLTYLADHEHAIAERDVETIAELIRRAVKVKVAVVQQDERESGVRALLNLGHTFGHAIEPIRELDLRHGEAVAIGLCAAAHAAVGTDRLLQEEADSVRDLLDLLELPTRLPRAVPVERLMTAMGWDKKVADGRLRLILPAGLGAAAIVDDAPAEVIEAAWVEVGATR